MARKSALIDTSIIYCGDCLDQLRKLPDGCIDLIYIDPPFNSNRNYEVFWGETKEKRAFEDRHASTQAYIEFMRPRCVELTRVLKKSGSLYYHCDWHASHYVKVMLDQILGENNFQNEIVWKRSSSPHNDPKRYGANHDTLLFYAGPKGTWNPQYLPLSEDYVKETFRYVEPDGRRYRLQELTANKPGGDVSYKWKGVSPPAGRYWAYSKENMEKFDKAGIIHYSKSGFPRYKQYLDDSKGVPLQTFWDDIANATGAERLGYPTQKPLELLERLITSSSNQNDIVLDAFCGCGTALVASQRLKRQWVGIDISPTACRVVAKRLHGKECRLPESETLWEDGKGFIVRDLPRSEAELHRLPPFEFENWAVIAIGGIPNRAKVGDMGIDGRIFPVSAMPERRGKQTGELDFMDIWYPIQVKQRDKAGRPDIDAFEAMMVREERTKGFFVSFDYSADAMTEIGRFFRQTGKVIVPFTVGEILNEQIAQKLA